MRSRLKPSIQLIFCLSELLAGVRVTPVRDALLRVLLGRSYTLSVRLVRLSVRVLARSVRFTCDMLSRLVRDVVARTPLSALAGPVARGT